MGSQTNVLTVEKIFKSQFLMALSDQLDEGFKGEQKWTLKGESVVSPANVNRVVYGDKSLSVTGVKLDSSGGIQSNYVETLGIRNTGYDNIFLSLDGGTDYDIDIPTGESLVVTLAASRLEQIYVKTMASVSSCSYLILMA